MNSWLDLPSETDFTIYNFPFGIGIINGESQVVSRIGDHIISLVKFQKASGFSQELPVGALINPFLNDFISLGKKVTVQVREELIGFFSDSSNEVNPTDADYLISSEKVEMQLPIDIRDYTDFYSSIEHATNVGTMFRDPNNALLPNWRHLPVGYHGRASSIVVSGTEIKRPHGQQKPNADEPPVYGKSKLLDFELEMGFVIGKPTALGESVTTENAEEHIFGLTLFNDWSARDIQKWEYVPLGPFLGKNFGSTMSCWIVTLEALEPFRVKSIKQDPEVLDYLKYDGNRNYDIDLYVDIVTPNGDVNTVSTSNFKYMYWNMCQQLAHHTVNGCNINVGDLYASGTISGKDEKSYGSMLELSWRGTKPLKMKDGSERKFIKDGDVVSMRGSCTSGEKKIGFGECKGKII